MAFAGHDLTFTDEGKIKHSIVLNPGHGYGGLGDTGVIGVHGLRECDVARQIAEPAARILTREGHTVRVIQSANLLGTEKELESLECVLNETLAAGPDVFVTIHLGEGYRRKRGYSSVVRYPRSLSWALGTQIQTEVWDATVDYDPRYWDRGVIIDASKEILNHLSKNNMQAAVLFHAGFLDNEQDAEMLANHAAEIGEALGKGILKYFDYVDTEELYQYNLKMALKGEK